MSFLNAIKNLIPGLVGEQYDDDESYDASDEGEVVVPEGTDAILYAQMLEDLKNAGFPEEVRG